MTMHAHEHHAHHGQQPQPRSAADDRIDPVCGMTVKPSTAHRTIHRGHDYLFCSAHCLKKFSASPESFAQSADETTGASSAPPPLQLVATDDPGRRREWTCPMHPEVVRDTPGACPKCGMALEPRTISLDQDEENPE